MDCGVGEVEEFGRQAAEVVGNRLGGIDFRVGIVGLGADVARGIEVDQLDSVGAARLALADEFMEEGGLAVVVDEEVVIGIDERGDSFKRGVGEEGEVRHPRLERAKPVLVGGDFPAVEEEVLGEDEGEEAVAEASWGEDRSAHLGGNRSRS